MTDKFGFAVSEHRKKKKIRMQRSWVFLVKMRKEKKIVWNILERYQAWTGEMALFHWNSNNDGLLSFLFDNLFVAIFVI